MSGVGQPCGFKVVVTFMSTIENFRRFSMIFDNIITVISILCQQLVIILVSCLGFVSHSDTIRYFPLGIKQTNYFLKTLFIKSLLAHLKVARQLTTEY